MMFKALQEKTFSSRIVLIFFAVFFSLSMNAALWRHLLQTYPLNPENLGFLISFLIGHTGFILLILALLCFRLTLKPVLVLLLLASSGSAYFMDRYDTIIDDTMLNNIMATDTREAASLFSFRLLAYVLFLGVLPSWLIMKARVTHHPWRRETGQRLLMIVAILLLAGGSIWGFSRHYMSFFREHKDIHHYSNPAGYLSAAFNVIKPYFEHERGPLQKIAADAVIPPHPERELIIMVVGETARADRFSLNGYAKKTNPLLEKEQVYSFTNVWSCGSSTIQSVPCMFSNLTIDEFSRDEAASRENVLDVLARAGVHVLWRDNNSSSKGVADRIPYESFLTPDVNPACDTECRDMGMLSGLKEYIDARPAGDIVIVLHQMGSHGPSYYQRYPLKFEVFTPACHTNELKDCTKEELDNVYDNTILYTDYFLSRVIDFLKQYDDRFETAMFYASDHGESLGENGLYLHGMPMMFAPDAQRHVPMIFWFGSRTQGIIPENLRKRLHDRYTHENVFHTLLGLVEMQTKSYHPDKDMVHQ